MILHHHCTGNYPTENTIARMLLLFVAAAQSVQPVHVIVDHVPSTPGVPEWIKLLITGLSGLTVGLLMEYAKPWLTKRRKQKSVAKQIADEVVVNIRVLEASLLILDEIGDTGGSAQTEKQRSLTGYFMGNVDFLRSTAHDHYLKQEVATMIALDSQMLLRTFYHSCSLARSMRNAQQVHPQQRATIEYAAQTGHIYLKDKRVKYSRDGFPLSGVENDLKVAHEHVENSTAAGI